MHVFIFPILGALIGYFTNLLAIVMLFRPHKQLRIGRFKVPFTPGLIPKGRHELAQKIGETLGKEVLTSQTLLDALANPEVISTISARLEEKINHATQDARPLSELYQVYFEKDPAALHNTLEKWGHDLVNQSLNHAHNAIGTFGAGKTIEEALPAGILNDIFEALNNRTYQAADVAQAILDHPKWGTFLHQTGTKIIKDNAKGLVGLFINPDKIYNNLTNSLIEYLKSDDGQTAISGHLQQLRDYANNLEMDALPENTRTWTKEALATLTDRINEENLPNRAVAHLLSLSPEQIITPVMRKKATSALYPLVEFLIKRAGGVVVQSIDISSLVEQKINEMDIKEVESMMLAIAGKHLKWIAILGGIIGFFAGFIPLIFL